MQSFQSHQQTWQSRQQTCESGGRSIRIDAALASARTQGPALLLLHGAGGNTGRWFSSLAPLAARTGLALFAVHYFDRTGTQRAGPAELNDGVHVPAWLETVSDALDHVRAQPGVDPARVAILGISLGAFLALALAPQAPGRIRALVEVSGGLAPAYEPAYTSAAAATPASAASLPRMLLLHGAADQVVPVSFAYSLDQTLTRLGVPHQTEILPGEGHWFSPAAQLRLLTLVAAFLGQHLA